MATEVQILQKFPESRPKPENQKKIFKINKTKYFKY